MIPTSFMQLDEMPKTPNGKIDAKSLPVPKLSSKHVNADSELEKSIFEICSEIMGFDDFGVTDDLYELGFTIIGLIRKSTLLSFFSNRQFAILPKTLKSVMGLLKAKLMKVNINIIG